ncbi:protein rep [Lapillicoccus sp.]|uniref:protein rep n=1 Tax=Lapillicoccus sp. TaxID=1909287 RepID=UPI0025DF3C1A|nr:protein rep [Lapillicoccus sp.]
MTLTDARWQVLDYLRDGSTARRQRLCTTRGILPVAPVRRSETGVSVGGVMVCGSRNCPMCGPRLYSRNRDEIRQCVAAWQAYGGSVLFGTFTVGHDLTDSLSGSLTVVTDAWAAVTSGKFWVRDRRDHGVTHWVRVLEEKYSETTGWHAHLHWLAFVEPGHATSASALLRSMLRRWSRSAESAGRRVSDRAQDLHEVVGVDAERVLGDYFTKQAEDRGRLTPDAMAHELASRSTKRSGTSITPAELQLLAALGGDRKWQLLYAEYERATAGRRVIAFSRGLRDFAGVGDEQDPWAVSAEETAKEGSVALLLRGRDVRKAMSRALRREFVGVVLADGGAAAVSWLEDRGMTGFMPDERSTLDEPATSFGPAIAPEYEGALPW